MPKSMGAEYNLEAGLDWARIRAEYEAAATPEELVHEAAAARAIQKQGATAAAAAAAGQEAVARAFPAAAEPPGEPGAA